MFFFIYDIDGELKGAYRYISILHCCPEKNPREQFMKTYMPLKRNRK